jgi:hypothetical protein
MTCIPACIGTIKSLSDVRPEYPLAPKGGTSGTLHRAILDKDAFRTKMTKIMNPKTVKEKIFNKPGYSTDLCLSSDELEFFRFTIEKQWLACIAARYPEHGESFRKLGLTNYHKLAHLVNHKTLWDKESRLFQQKTVEKIKQLPFMEKLKTVFGEFSISDVVCGNTIFEGRQEIYWRIVRPDAVSDVGPLHADKWFHNVLGSGYGMFPPGIVTVKLWIPIYCEPGKSGLIVVPDSHKRDWRYEYVEKDGFKKPVILENLDDLGGVLVPTDPGTLLIFNERLLHGGAVNLGDKTRVSGEITLVLERFDD